MTKPSDHIEVARITSRQAVTIALITAVGGIAAGYFSRQSPEQREVISTSTKIERLETEAKSLIESRDAAIKAANEARASLFTMKQRVRDILGPKEDVLRRMGESLVRLRGDPGVSIEHQERLAEIAKQLRTIDTKVLNLAEP